jgi:hypothetical protein
MFRNGLKRTDLSLEIIGDSNQSTDLVGLHWPVTPEVASSSLAAPVWADITKPGDEHGGQYG